MEFSGVGARGYGAKDNGLSGSSKGRCGLGGGGFSRTQDVTKLLQVRLPFCQLSGLGANKRYLGLGVSYYDKEGVGGPADPIKKNYSPVGLNTPQTRTALMVYFSE